MPYYHVFLDDVIEGEKEELDLSKDDLFKFIVKPYLDAGELFLAGSFLDPLSVTTIEIFETDKKATMVSSEHFSSLRSVTSFSLLAQTTERAIRARGRNVTKQFITHSPRRVKKPSRKLGKRSRNVFIVHGRDHEPMKDLKVMLKDFGLKPIVLHEQPSGSRTIVENLEKHSDVGYAFVILTPDDLGGACKDRSLLRLEAKERARQNVILEFGYFIGKLGRDRVCCLYKGNVELPSDMHGIVYIPFKESVNEVMDKIIKELREARLTSN